MAQRRRGLESHASVLRHPIHPMLIPFPIALFTAAALFDIISVFAAADLWHDLALGTMVLGWIGGVAAAIPGAIDWWSTNMPRSTYRIATIHGLINASVLVVFAVNILIRVPDATLGGGMLALGVLLSLIGVGLLGISGWLGGELVYRHHLAVEEPGAAAPRGVVGGQE